MLIKDTIHKMEKKLNRKCKWKKDKKKCEEGKNYNNNNLCWENIKISNICFAPGSFFHFYFYFTL